MSWGLRNWWLADRAYFRAFRSLRSAKPGEAVKSFDQVLAIFPRHVRAHAQRALALAAAGHVGQAVSAARRAAELAPDSHAPLLFLGRIQFDAGNLEEARKAFSAALRADGENRMLKGYLGLTQLAQGRLEEGAEALQEHLAYGYEGLEGRLITLAEQYLWQHRDQARPLEQQLTYDEGGGEETSAGFGLRLASALRRVLLWPLARLRGRVALHLMLAHEAASLGDHELAIQHLREAEKAGAEPQRLALSLGQAYLDAGNSSAAAEQFSLLPDRERKQPDVALLIGAALFDAGRYEEAREPIAIAARRFTRDFAPAYYRGLCEIALGNPKAALPWFLETASRLNPHVARKRLEEMLRVRAL